MTITHSLLSPITHYNPITLLHTLSLTLTLTQKSKDRCPLPAWGYFTLFLSLVLSALPLLVAFIFVKDWKRQGEVNLLRDLAQMEYEQQLEYIFWRCVEEGISPVDDMAGTTQESEKYAV